ncbi:MAG: hypothetical protein II715_01825 [Clostridia bacterium]|nr:hypothetical protein [Clostridia bacterium]
MIAKKAPVADALRIGRIRCVVAITVCSFICVLTFFGLVSQLVSQPNGSSEEVGWKAFHMFTLLSNILMAVSAVMCIPFAVDGIRSRNYHLPRWCVNLLYTGTAAVTLTFVAAATAISSVIGFRQTMLTDSNLIFHTICPVLSILLFIFINSDHKVRFRASFIAMIPALTYSVVYVLLVFVIGKDAGGWRDHYQVYRLTDHVPLPVVLPVFYLMLFGLFNGLRALHNLVHKYRKAGIEKYFQEAEAFDCPDLPEAIRALAESDRVRDGDGELTVPRRIMRMMEKKYRSGLSEAEMCELYVRAYYSSVKGRDGSE